MFCGSDGSFKRLARCLACLLLSFQLLLTFNLPKVWFASGDDDFIDYCFIFIYI